VPLASQRLHKLPADPLPTPFTLRRVQLHMAPIAVRMALVQIDVHLLFFFLLSIGLRPVDRGLGVWVSEGFGRVEEGVAAFGAEEVELVIVAWGRAEGGVGEGEEAGVDDGRFAGVAAGGEELMRYSGMREGRGKEREWGEAEEEN
jgi:hypothetical protein